MAAKLGYKNVYRYPTGYPEWQEKGLPVESVTLQTFPKSSAESKFPLTGLAIVWTLLGVFLSGMALNLTPCVYPLIPITVSYFGGRSGQGKGRLAAHGLFYIGGLAFINSILGVMAALSGSMVGSLLQNPWVLGGVASVLLVFASSLLGFWELKLPSTMTQAAAKSYSGYFGSLFMGLTLGVIAAPCIGPFVLGLLTWVASMGDPLLGFIVFFTLSLGLGIPLLVLALFSGNLEKLPRSGDWMIWIRKLLGWVLVGMAAYFIRPVLPKMLGTLIFAVIPLAGGIHLGWVQKIGSAGKLFRWLKTIAGLGGVLAATILIGSWLTLGPEANWSPYSQRLLTESKSAGKPVIIDFSADWCAPCRELDEITFRDDDIVKMSAEKIVMIKVDLTQTGNLLNEKLVQQYKIKGVPTVLFFDRNGIERTDLRLVDFMSADQFLLRLAELIKVKSQDPN